MRNIFFIVIVLLFTACTFSKESDKNEENNPVLNIANGDYDKALNFYRNELKGDSSDYKVFNDIGLLYLLNEAHDSAFFYYKKSINCNKNKNNITTYTMLGGLYERYEDTLNALHYFNEAIKRNTDDPYVSFHIARIYLGKKDLKSAIKYYKIAYSLEANYLDTRTKIDSLESVLKRK